jgi:hypothetical protein
LLTTSGQDGGKITMRPLGKASDDPCGLLFLLPTRRPAFLYRRFDRLFSHDSSSSVLLNRRFSLVRRLVLGTLCFQEIQHGVDGIV